MNLLSDEHVCNFPQMQKLRVILSRGSANTKEQLKFYRSQFPKTHVMNAIGCAEMAMLLAFFDPKTEFALNIEKVDSVGKLCPGVDAKIVDLETEKELDKNEKGELFLKSKCMMAGYYKDPEATKAAFTEDMWYRTGDVAYFDDDECLYIVGRIKEILTYNTFTVSTTEVEYIINKHPDVIDSCVMGVRDRVSGDLPLAFVVKKVNSKVTERDIIDYVDEFARDHQRLRGGVIFIDEMPLAANGKPRRGELQKLVPKPCECFPGNKV